MEEELLMSKEGEENGWSRWKEEAQRVGYVATPIMVMIVSQFLLQIISTMMVGHIGELTLSSAAITTSLTSVTGYSIILGVASGLEILCGQAYEAQQNHKLGIYIYGAIFSLLLVCIPISLIRISMGKILPMVGQDPLIPHEAAKLFGMRLL